MKVGVGKNQIDYRVSILPTIHGEKVVLRLLDSSNLQVDMSILGFDSAQSQILKTAIHKPYGMCLITGPTGSGKTTTLYSLLLDLNDSGSNIGTVTRLLNMGFEPFLISSALNVIVAQRLCRKICTECKTHEPTIKVEYLVSCGFSKGTAEKIKPQRGKGCKACNITDNIKDLIIRRASESELKAEAKTSGMKNLRVSALTKVAQSNRARVTNFWRITSWIC